MPKVDIILADVTKSSDLFRLKNYLRTLFALFDPRVNTLTFAASITLDASTADTFFITLTNNVTGITIKNAANGRRFTIVFLQDGTGGRTVAGWPADILLSGASFTVTTNANRYSSISFVYLNSKWIEVGRTTDVR